MRINRYWKFEIETTIVSISYYLLPIGLLAGSLFYHFYSGGNIILGGEGDFFIDFERHAEVYGSAWFDIGYGWPNVIPNAIGINHDILIMFMKLTNSYRFVNFLLILFMYSIPYIVFCLLVRHLGGSRKSAIILAVLYVIGPFSINYLQALNQWNVFSTTIIPLLYFVVHRYAYSQFKLFILTGVATYIFSFSLYNPPTAAIVLSTVLIAGWHYVLDNRSEVDSLIKKYFSVVLIAYTGFIFFNLDWIIVLLYSIKNNFIDAIFTADFAVTWAESVSSPRGLLAKVLSQRQVLAANTVLDLYYGKLIVIVSIYGLISYLVFKSFQSKCKFQKHLVVLLLLLIFLSKGTSEPFGIVYHNMMNNVPFFYIFKTPTEKFGIMLHFIIFLLAALVVVKQNSKTINDSLIFILFVCVMPVLLQDGFAASSYDGNYKMSRKQNIANYLDVIDYLNKNYKNERILSLPGSLNYQVMLRADEGNYTGLDPVLNNAHISYIYPGIDKDIYNNLFSSEWLSRVRANDISAIVYNTNEIPWFGEATSLDVSVISVELKKLGLTEVVINDYYIWDIPFDNQKLIFKQLIE